MTIVCMLIIEKLGRKLLLLIGMMGMCVFSFLIGISIILKDQAEWLQYLTIVAVFIYIGYLLV